MLYSLFSLIILIPVLYGFGRLLGKKHSVSFALLVGICSVSVIWLLVAFFFPLNIYTEGVTVFAGLSSFFYFRLYDNLWSLIKPNWKILTSVLLVILFFGSFYPFILDHFGYYVPTIKWLSEVGLVKGISNLDLLLGQTSLWHIFQSGFSNFSDPFLRINLVALLAYLIYILEKKQWIHLVFFPILFFFVQSPSPDLSAIVFSLIILNEIILKNKNTTFLFLFSAFVFGIKPTMIWVPILVFLYSIFIQKNHLKTLLPGTILLLIISLKNIWVFGYPIFPVQILDFNVPWKPNAELMKTSSEMAIQKTYDMQYSIAEIQKFTLFQHIKNWFLLDGIKGKIHILFILSLVGFGIFTWQKKQKIITFIFVSILIKSILVLLFSAQYRFFIDVFFVIAFVIGYPWMNQKKSVSAFTLQTLALIILFAFPKLLSSFVPSFRLGGFMSGFQAEQLLKPSVYEYQEYSTHTVGNLRFNMVEHYSFSFETPIPAISPEFVKQYYDVGIFPKLMVKS